MFFFKGACIYKYTHSYSLSNWKLLVFLNVAFQKRNSIYFAFLKAAIKHKGIEVGLTIFPLSFSLSESFISLYMILDIKTMS